jgi:hypothetical protein
MSRLKITLFMTAVASLAMLGASGLAAPDFRERIFRTDLTGFEEVPSVITTGRGNFRAVVSKNESSIEFELSYDDLEGTPSMAHIHIGQRGVNGNVSAFLCGGPKPPCPTSPAKITGTITASDILSLAAGQGVAAGEFDDFLRALRAGTAYANLHTDKFPNGEIRGQIR